MLTGTPLDLTPFGSILTGIGVLYGIVAIVAALYASTLPSSGWAKAVLGLLVFGAFIGPVAWNLWQRLAAQAEWRAKDEAANAVFQARCATAKTVVRRVVENVEGVWLAQVRPVKGIADDTDRHWAVAGLPAEYGGDGYIRTFLYWEHHDDPRNDRGYLNTTPSPRPGYRFVDVPDAGGEARRYTLARPPSADLATQPVVGEGARYAVSYESLDDPAAREHWIAGLTVRITDRSTGEQIAEQTWYSMEPGRGSTSGFRSPWGHGITCPRLTAQTGQHTRYFVDQVLRPVALRN